MTNSNKIIGIIPARYASTRLPAKPLVDICGLPMLIRVWQNVSQAKLLDKVIIATDDERILHICKQFGAEAVLTSPDLPSGTDRIYAAYQALCCKESIVVNIQGDEPLLTGETIDKLLYNFKLSNSDVGTIVTPIKHADDIFNPSCVKVVLDNNDNAMYFSRSPIPYIRSVAKEQWLDYGREHGINFWKHTGVYAYKINILEKFIGSPQSMYEIMESLEQLRLLEHAAKFFCFKSDDTLAGVDTPEDLALVSTIINQQPQ